MLSRKNATRRQAKGNRRRNRRPEFLPKLEKLVDRLLPATLDIVTGGAATYTAGSGIANVLTITAPGTNYSFNDTAENITVTGAGSGGCAGSGTQTVTCPQASISSMLIKGLNGADKLDAGALSLAVSMLGDTGNDTLIGGSGADSLAGDDGS